MGNEDKIIITGYTQHNGFPVTEDAYQKDGKGTEDAILIKFNRDGVLKYAA